MRKSAVKLILVKPFISLTLITEITNISVQKPLSDTWNVSVMKPIKCNNGLPYT